MHPSKRHDVQIRVQGPESDGSASSYCSDDSASSSSTSPHSIKINLTVEHQSERYLSTLTIDNSDNKNFKNICDKLESLRPEGSGTDDEIIECYYILSGTFQSEIKSPFRVASHLAKATDQYQSNSFTRFEVRETISFKITKDGTTALKTLQNKLSNAKIHCQPESQGDFIPESTLREIMNEGAVRALFKEDPDLFKIRDFEQVLQETCMDGYKLLASIILADIKTVGKTLLGFREASMLDVDMPFERKLRYPLDCVTDCEYNNIFNNQWSTIAFTLKPYDESMRNGWILDKEMVMPFLEMRKLNCGGFGDVYKIKVHPAHQNLSEIEAVSPWLREQFVHNYKLSNPGPRRLLCSQKTETNPRAKEQEKFKRRT
jgi:hypothetical protein